MGRRRRPRRGEGGAPRGRRVPARPQALRTPWSTGPARDPSSWAPGHREDARRKVVASASGANFYSQSASLFVEMFAGLGAARIRKLFEEARKHAPAIVFIDELDAVGTARMGGGFHREHDQTLNQLLVELDGFNARDEVVVMAASNRLQDLDTALLRPGRFDRQVLVSAPTSPAARRSCRCTRATSLSHPTSTSASSRGRRPVSRERISRTCATKPRSSPAARTPSTSGRSTSTLPWTASSPGFSSAASSRRRRSASLPTTRPAMPSCPISWAISSRRRRRRSCRAARRSATRSTRRPRIATCTRARSSSI